MRYDLVDFLVLKKLHPDIFAALFVDVNIFMRDFQLVDSEAVPDLCIIKLRRNRADALRHRAFSIPRKRPRQIADFVYPDFEPAVADIHIDVLLRRHCGCRGVCSRDLIQEVKPCILAVACDAAR